MGATVPGDEHHPSISDADQHLLVTRLTGAHARHDRPQLLVRAQQREQLVLFQLEVRDAPVVRPPIALLCKSGTRTHLDSIPCAARPARCDRLSPKIRRLVCGPDLLPGIGETPCRQSRHDMTETPAEAGPPSLHGRQDVVDAIAGLAAGAAVGQGGALTVVGEAGIGKTAVLDEGAGLILADQPDAAILRLRGVEAEVELAWSGLAELLAGMLGGIDRLAPARASAVRAALALEGTEQPVEPFAIALATRDLLVESAESA